MISELFFFPVLIFFESKTGSFRRAHVVLLRRLFHPQQHESINLPGNIKLVKQLEAPQVLFLSCIKLIFICLYKICGQCVVDCIYTLRQWTLLNCSSEGGRK